MKLQANGKSYLLIERHFMNYRIVKDILEEEGSDGLGVVMALLLHLCQRKDGIAKVSSVRSLACQLRTGYLYTCHIIEDYELFRLTEDGLSYYSPYLHKTADAEGMGVAWILDLSTSEGGRDN